MKPIIRRVYSKNGAETGAVLSTSGGVTFSLEEKESAQSDLETYARDVLYPSEHFNVFNGFFNESPSIVVIRNVDDLDYTEGNH